MTVFISKLLLLHGVLSFQNKHMSGNLWLSMRTCSDIIFKRQRTKLKCYIFMQSCRMQQENEVPTQNIMETLCLCGPTKQNAHVSRIVFVLDYQQTHKKVKFTKRLLIKRQPFFVDVTIIVLTQQICILELSNQVLKLVF